MHALRFVIAGLVIGSSVVGGEFAQFRGNAGNGQVSDCDIPLFWDAETNVAWKTAVPGSGWAQPIVWKDRIYIASAVCEKDLTPANFASGVRSPQSMGITLFAKAPSSEIQWSVFCVNASDGSTIWSTRVSTGKAKYSVHPSNSYATETPVADQDGVYVYFGAAGIVAAINHDGALRWQQDIGVFKTSNGFGTGSSLAIDKGRVFAQNYNEESSTVYCFDSESGAGIWKQSRPKAVTSWSSPVVWKNAVRTELVVSGGEQLESFDPATGRVLWSLTNVKAATACSPCTDQPHLSFGGSDPFSTGPLFAVKAGANGDLSPRKKNAGFEACGWLAEKQGPGMASPVSSEDFVYVTDKSVLKCFDAKTGERVYQARLPGLKMVAASPLIVGRKLLFVDEYGHACVIAAGPEFKLLGKGTIDDTFWATPAIAGDAIILRGVKALYCVRK